MTIISGQFAEVRLYLTYCLAVFRPGHEVPTFADPVPYSGNLDHFFDDDLQLLIDEGRRQFDRQVADLDRIRNRAGILGTLSLGLTAALVSSSPDVFKHSSWIIAGWATACLLALLAVAGAASVLTARAVFGRIDTRLAAQGPRPTLRFLAAGYIRQVSTGEETVRTFLTVFRNAVFLTILSALLLLGVVLITIQDAGQ